MSRYNKQNYGLDTIESLTKDAFSLFPAWASMLEDASPRRLNCFSDKGEEYFMELEVAGFGKEDLEVEVSNNKYLTIKGSAKVRGRDTKISERFLLPKDSDNSTIKAKVDKGLLSVRVEKAKEAKPLQIEVS